MKPGLYDAKEDTSSSFTGSLSFIIVSDTHCSSPSSLLLEFITIETSDEKVSYFEF